MREIKFRAWNKIVKQILYNVYPIDQEGTCNFGSGTIINCEVMQYTGLKDKNGKEIYEGDIVSIKSQYETDEPIDTKARVEFFDGAFILDFHAMRLTWAVLEYKNSNWLIEIIGNIYENPELLTKLEG